MRHHFTLFYGYDVVLGLQTKLLQILQQMMVSFEVEGSSGFLCPKICHMCFLNKLKLAHCTI